MKDKSLQGCRVLLVEDDFLIADDFARRLETAGAEVIGPAATLPIALSLYESSEKIDFVILDISLRGTAVFPMARRLDEDGVPFLFCTGYDDEPVRDGFGSVPHFEKPVSQHGFAAMIDLIDQSRQDASRLASSMPAGSPHLPM